MAYRFLSDTVVVEDNSVSILNPASGDTLSFLRSALYLASGTNAHVVNLRRITALTIDGQLYSSSGATVYGAVTNATTDVQIGADALVRSSAGNAFDLAGAALTFDNFGQVAGRIALKSTVADVSMTNAGALSGVVHGIYHRGRLFELSNSGTIASSGNGIFADASGGIAITNSGTISGQTGTGLALTTAADSYVVNTGTISGRIGVQFLGYYPADIGVRTFDNQGVLAGRLMAYQGSGAVDQFSNSGRVTGSIDLAGGDDYYDGRDGKVSGTVSGGAGDDILHGSATGRNTLSGGDGSDRLIGGAADDVFLPGTPKVNGAVDYVEGGAGRDMISFRDVPSSVTYVDFSLSDDKNIIAVGVEDVEGSGSRDDLVGDAGVNRLYGLAGNDSLDGLGGNDLLYGGPGDDGYVVDAEDLVVELFGEGIDTVYVSWSGYRLPANVENLWLIGEGNHSGSGNSLANYIRGNAGENLLVGYDGNDTLAGLGGADDFAFFDFNSIDTIQDFEAGDEIWVARTYVKQMPAGTLADSAFWVGTTAHDADDRFIFNPTTHALYYDADGTGATAAIQFAIVNGSAPTAAGIYLF
jgi:hypothetical protein